MGQWAHFDKTGAASVAGYPWGEIPAGKPSYEDGTAQAGGGNTITLAANESAVADAYKDLQIALLTGPGAGDHRTITAYNGTSKQAQVSSAWSTPPTSATTYRIFKAVKFGVLNLGPRALTAQVRIEQKDDSDGFGMATIALDAATLSPPANVTAVAVAGGGSFPATGAWYYRLTATNAAGETVGSIEVGVALTAGTQTVNLAFTPPVGATAIKVYRTQSPGTYTAALRATLAGTATSYADTGGAVGAGNLPTANTTGGAAPDYGTPPALASFGTAALALGTVQPGEMRHYWVNVTVPNGTPEEGNDRAFNITLAEV